MLALFNSIASNPQKSLGTRDLQQGGNGNIEKQMNPSKKKPSFIKVILSFLKIGTIGFGGGAALIPILESEIVERNNWVKKDKFDLFVATASISPSSIPVSIAAIWNMRFSLFTAYAYGLPGSIIFMILLTGFSVIGEAGVRYIEYASAGILVFVLMLIYKFIRKNIQLATKAEQNKQFLIVVALSLVLRFGNDIRRLISMLFDLGNFHEWPPITRSVFALSMLDIILILFFLVCFIGSSKNKVKRGIGIGLALLYALAIGRMGILSPLAIPLVVVMILLAVTSVLYDTLRARNQRKDHGLEEGSMRKNNGSKLDLAPIKNILLFLVVALGLTGLAFVSSGDGIAVNFALRGLTSSLQSFGGGEVFYAIAEETFVQTEMLSRDFYMTHVMGIAGAMPGPVIVAILSGVGFGIGANLGGIGLAWVFGIVGGSMAITATGFGALTLYMVFDYLKDSPRLKMIVKYIIPVVCGVLLSVSLQLIERSAWVISSVGIPIFMSLLIVMVMLVTMITLNRKLKMPDILYFLVGGGFTLVGLTVISGLF